MNVPEEPAAVNSNSPPPEGSGRDEALRALRDLSPTPTTDEVVAAVGRFGLLADALPPVECVAASTSAAEILRDKGRKDAAKLVNAARPTASDGADAAQGRALSWNDPQRWPEPVDGAMMLDEIVGVIRRYIVVPGHAADAVALWVALSYCIDHAHYAPRLILSSPTRECGKTRFLSVLTAMVRRPLTTGGITSAALFRVLEKERPTVLLDEADNARLDENDELRAVLNSGHAHGGVVIRTVGDGHEPRMFDVFGLVALAAIGRLPDTLTSRSLVVPMQRKPRGQNVGRLRERRLAADLEPLRRKLVGWAADNGHRLVNADPEIPPALDGRAADTWEGLVAIADLAGGAWPDRARRTATLFAGRAEADEAEAGVMLLSDLRILFDEKSADKLPSTEILAGLIGMGSRPWSEWLHGKPITDRWLAGRLRPFEVEPRKLRDGERSVRGYYRETLASAWDRYLPLRRGTLEQGASTADETAFSIRNTENERNTVSPATGAGCSAVPGQTANLWPEQHAALETRGWEPAEGDGGGHA